MAILSSSFSFAAEPDNHPDLIPSPDDLELAAPLLEPVDATLLESDVPPNAEQIRTLFRDVMGVEYEKWVYQRDTDLPVILDLAKELLQRARHYGREHGWDELLNEINANKWNYTEESTGHRVELTNIDNHPIARVILAHSNQAFIFLDLDHHVPDSSHLREYVGKQHLDAGHHRTDGQRGRDLVIIWTHQNKVIDTTYLARPALFSPAWWREYGAVILKKPTLEHGVFGTFCGLAQGTMALCVSGAQSVLDSSSALDYKPAVMSVIFGTTIAIFVKSYRAWTLIGTDFSRKIKSGSISLAFSVPLFAWQGRLDPSMAAIFFTMTHLSLNAYFNNWFKTECHNVNKVRERNRLNADTIEIYHRGKREWVKLKELTWADLEHQAMYLIPFTIRLADLTHLSIPLDSFTSDYAIFTYLIGNGIPLGKALLWGLIPVAQYKVLQWAKRNNYGDATYLQERFNRAKSNSQNLLLNTPYRVAHEFGLNVGVALPSHEQFDFHLNRVTHAISELPSLREVAVSATNGLDRLTNSLGVPNPLRSTALRNVSHYLGVSNSWVRSRPLRCAQLLGRIFGIRKSPKAP